MIDLPNTLSVQILNHLNLTGPVKRKLLVLPFTDYSYSYYAKKLNALIKSDFIVIKRKEGISFCCITTKGRRYLHDALGSNSATSAQTPNFATATGSRRQNSVSSVKILCSSLSIAVDKAQKPTLSALMSVNKTLGVTYDIPSILNQGVFYSLAEIKSHLNSISVGGEILSKSRLVGIIIKGQNVKFIYSIENKLINLSVESEAKTVNAVLSILKRSVLSKYINLPAKPECIVLVRSYNMLPKLITGSRSGTQLKTKYEIAIATQKINQVNLSKVFSSSYVVIANSDGGQDFAQAISLNPAIRRSLFTSWFAEQPSFSLLESPNYFQGMSTTTGARIIIHLYLELNEIAYYKNQNTPFNSILPPGSQEALAKIYGPLLLKAKDFTNCNLKYAAYDPNGNQVENPN